MQNILSGDGGTGDAAVGGTASGGGPRSGRDARRAERRANQHAFSTSGAPTAVAAAKGFSQIHASTRDLEGKQREVEQPDSSAEEKVAVDAETADGGILDGLYSGATGLFGESGEAGGEEFVRPSVESQAEAPEGGGEAGGNQDAAAEGIRRPKDAKTRKKDQRQRLNDKSRMNQISFKSKPRIEVAVPEGLYEVRLGPEAEDASHGLAMNNLATGRIEEVEANSAGYRRGIRPGDELVAVDEMEVATYQQGESVLSVFMGTAVHAALAKRPLKLWLRAGCAANDRDYHLLDDGASLGCGFTYLPAHPVRIETVFPETWGERCGVRQGDEIRLVGAVPAVSMDTVGLQSALKERPLKLRLRCVVGGAREYNVLDDIAELGIAFDGEPPRAVQIQSVSPGLWAEASGLAVGDQLLAVEGIAIHEIQGGVVELDMLLSARPLRLTFRLNLGAPPEEEDYAKMDTDGDRRISREEFEDYQKAAHSTLLLDISPETAGSAKEDTFATIDTDGDGLVSPEEFRRQQDVQAKAAQSSAFPIGLPTPLHGNDEEFAHPELDRDRVAQLARLGVGAMLGGATGAVHAERIAQMGHMTLGKKLFRHPLQAEQLQSPAMDSKWTMPPAVAMKLIPDLSRATTTPTVMPAASPQGIHPAPKMSAIADPNFYARAWCQQAPHRHAGPAAVPLRFSYEQIVLQRLGPLHFEPQAAMSAQQFQNQLLEGTLDYQVQQACRKDEVPRSRVNYLRMMKPVPYPSEDTVDEARRAVQENRSIAQAMLRDAARLRSNLPREARDGGREVVVDEDEDDTPIVTEPDASEFFRVRLKINVVKATNLPEAEFMYDCSPYVVASVVDGDPLSVEARCGGEGEAARHWYSERQQLRLQTEALHENRNPVWNATLIGECRPRETSHIHFTIMNDEHISARDKTVGQAAVPLSDILNNLWYAPRSVALIPFDRKNQKRWAQLYNTRLIVSVTWEGIRSQVTATPKTADLTSSSSASKRLAQRKEKLAGRGRG